jgi:quercetin dioxygenase-like cupin family protein
MVLEDAARIRAAEVVLPCADLDATVAFFTARLGFRIEAVFPADDPRVTVISGHGLTLRLDRALRGDPGRLRLPCRDPRELGGGARECVAPNGTRVELVDAAAPIELPPLAPELVSSRGSADGEWRAGRAGMFYRDLVPGRQGGRFVASHIRIPRGGPVADYVHFHRIAFQLIYCLRGWARLVYEDQGPPFVLQAGDAVLQPPEIRHRVLECSAGLEVVEVSSPAEHETRADHELVLPSPDARPDRSFAGQRFVHHRAETAAWRPWRMMGFEARDLGLAAASGGLVGAAVARRSGALDPRPCRHDAELRFLFVIVGALTFRRDERGDERLGSGSSLVVPAGIEHALVDGTRDLELLEVGSPAAFELRCALEPS